MTIQAIASGLSPLLASGIYLGALFLLLSLGSEELAFVRNKDVDHMMDLDMEDGSTHKVTGADVYNLVFNSGQPWNISANGTIFKTDFQGIVPGLLERWYAERQQMQKKKKEATAPEEIAFWDKRQLVKRFNLIVYMVQY